MNKGAICSFKAFPGRHVVKLKTFTVHLFNTSVPPSVLYSPQCIRYLCYLTKMKNFALNEEIQKGRKISSVQ